MKVISTKKLKLLVQEAKKKNFNRYIPDKVMATVDPVGKHVMCSQTFLHGNPPDDMVVRVPIMVKVEGSMIPVEKLLDVSLESYAAIPTYKE